MPTTKQIDVKDLSLDLSNFRTVSQRSEIKAIHAMISISPDWFWALTESLLADGYLPTENIIVLHSSKTPREFIVKEGNRRIAALKLIYGYVDRKVFGLPDDIEEGIAKLSSGWKKENSSVPCAVYSVSEASVVDKIVTLAHGKGEKAGRDKWNAVAGARHNRDKGGESEPALDLLERYLKNGRNITPEQSMRWSGAYPLTILEEATKILAPRFDAASSRQLADSYPSKVKNREVLETILRDIGLEQLDFKKLRDKTIDFATAHYGLPPGSQNKNGGRAGRASATGTTTTAPTTSPRTTERSKAKAVSIDDPRSVKRVLKSFMPRGADREKLVALLIEARGLNLETHPHSFCFLLRSMFEISAKAYCKDHARTGGPVPTKPSGEDKKLVDLLREITIYMTANGSNKAMNKLLHGAMTELARSVGILSVTSMNQLIHNTRFSIHVRDICVLFGNVFPLLEEMNR